MIKMQKEISSLQSDALPTELWSVRSPSGRAFERIRKSDHPGSNGGHPDLLSHVDHARVNSRKTGIS